MITKNGNVMNKVYDWRGNKIEPGMTIYFVRTTPSIFETARYGLMFVDKDGNRHQQFEDEAQWLERKKNIENSEIWELGEPLEVVVNTAGQLCYKIVYENDPDIESVISPFGGFFGEKQTIAIKGISDKKY